MEKIATSPNILRIINGQFGRTVIPSELRNGPAPEPKRLSSSAKLLFPGLGWGGLQIGVFFFG